MTQSFDRCPLCRSRLLPDHDPVSGPEWYCLAGHRVQAIPVQPPRTHPEQTASGYDHGRVESARQRAERERQLMGVLA